MPRKSFDAETLARLRDVDCVRVFKSLDGFFKRDISFASVKSAKTERWYCTTAAGEFELLVTGPRWYDTRRKHGGGGAIDLAMALTNLSFVDSVKLLVERGL